MSKNKSSGEIVVSKQVWSDLSTKPENTPLPEAPKKLSSGKKTLSSKWLKIPSQQ